MFLLVSTEEHLGFVAVDSDSLCFGPREDRTGNVITEDEASCHAYRNPNLNATLGLH